MGVVILLGVGLAVLLWVLFGTGPRSRTPASASCLPQVHPDVYAEAKALIGVRWTSDLSLYDNDVLSTERARTIQNVMIERTARGLPNYL